MSRSIEISCGSVTTRRLNSSARGLLRGQCAAVRVGPRRRNGEIALDGARIGAGRRRAAGHLIEQALRAVARDDAIETSITAEDGTPADRTTAQTKDDAQLGRQTVSHQLVAGGTRQAALDARTASARAVAGSDPRAAAAAAGAFEAAVRAYQDAYERRYLVSTDAPIKKATWGPTKQRDRLGNKTVQERLETWAKTLAYVKFVIPAGQPDEVYVGDPALRHIDIANDNALAAGLLRLKAGPLRVSEIENASGGYRPGPLRNAQVLARMIDHGYVQDDLHGTQVDHRPDGSYDGSKIAPH